MDGLLTGADSEEDIILIKNKINEILTRGCFKLQ